MFDKEKFSDILNKINNEYSNMTEFAKIANFDRTYISKYIHKRLDNPPTPKILMGISNASKGITSYEELMNLCGYITSVEIHGVSNSLINSKNNNMFVVPIFISENGKLCNTNEDIMLPTNLDFSKQYFGYRISDDSMLPLVGIGDLAIIQKSNTFNSGETCLISLDNIEIIIRKIVEFKDYIELQTAFPYNPFIKISNIEKENRKFKILGKVIKVENSSAFK